jgi:hypothetical protein
MATYFQGAVKSGDGDSELPSGVGVGTANFSQTALINFSAAGTANVDTTFTLPKGAQIINFIVDTLTAWDSVTSAGLTIGSTAGGTEYFTSVDVKSNGRETASNSAAQLAAFDDIGADTTVYVRVAQVGATAAGQARVTIQYTGGTL